MSRFPKAVVVCLLVAMEIGAVQSRPNIVFIMSDDVGWGDHEANNQHMATPNLIQMAKRGVVMTQSYTLQACTPTRSALLTGRYPFKFGLQIGKIKGTNLRWLKETLKLLPAYLKDLNYSTHAVGKWHLGFCNWKLTPRYRGFDTFYGFLGGAQSYTNHSALKPNGAFDFRDNERVAYEAKGSYSTELHTLRVQEIIKKRKKAVPFFIYMAYQNAHAPFEAKQRYIDQYCPNVKDKERQIHCAMVAAMDEGIGNITQTLRDEGIEDNTILIYQPDNGGPVKDKASNWPLRGGKSHFWEGGTRSYTILVYPKKVKNPGRTWDHLFHISDWLPSLYRAAGGDTKNLPKELDGKDQFYRITGGWKGTRTNMVYNIDDNKNRSAVRIGDFKLLSGNNSPSGWYAPPELEEEGEVTTKGKKLTGDKLALYNVRDDPTEKNNLISNQSYAGIVADLKAFLAEQMPHVVPYRGEASIPKAREGNPIYYSNVYSPGWCCF